MRGRTAAAGTRTRRRRRARRAAARAPPRTAASSSGPLRMPASTIGTKRGVACSYTSTAGFSSLIALKYAWVRTVAGRRDDADPPVAGRERGRGRAGPHHPEHGQVVAGAQVRQGDGGRRVAGDDERLDVARGELVERLASRTRGPRRRSGRRTGRGRCRRGRWSIRGASGGRSRAGRSAHRRPSRRRRWAGGRTRSRGYRRVAVAATRPTSSAATLPMSWLIWRGRVGEHERDALVVRPHDEPAAGAHRVLRHASERPCEGLGVEAAGRVGAVRRGSGPWSPGSRSSGTRPP